MVNIPGKGNASELFPCIERSFLVFPIMVQTFEKASGQKIPEATAIPCHRRREEHMLYGFCCAGILNEVELYGTFTGIAKASLLP